MEELFYIVENGKAYYSYLEPFDDVEYYVIHDVPSVFPYLLTFPTLFEPQTIH